MEPTNQIQKNNKPNKFVHVALVVGLVIVINLFLNYTLSVVYKQPNYDDYFNRPQVVESYKTQESCLSVGGQWTENSHYQEDLKYAKGREVVDTGYCDANYTKQKSFDEKQKAYDLNVFVTLIICGIALTILGIVRRHPILSPAFTWAGVLSYIIASTRYWGTATSILRVVILGIALVALIYVALKKFSNEN